jgi:AraC-like DNA-binding protein
MTFASLSTSAALEVRRYSGVDDFRQAFQFMPVEQVPTSVANTAPAQWILRLPGCEIYLLRAFPRLLDACIPKNHLMILLTMEDATEMTFNGVAVEPQLVAFLRGPSDYRIVERVARLNAAIHFDSRMDGRGWPAIESGLLSLAPCGTELARVRRLLSQLILSAAASPQSWLHAMLGQSARDSLLTALDAMLESSQFAGYERSPSYRKYLQIMDVVDSVLRTDPARPIYSEALAAAAGVSVRTLHNATVRLRGVSLHHYLRMRRLWLVRQRLLSGDPSLQVKSCALAYGFWHLGEFSSTYTSQFGELPSQTLARSRERARPA